MIRVEIERCSIKSIDKFEIMRKLLLTLYYLFVVCLGTFAQEPCPCVIPALQQWKGGNGKLLLPAELNKINSQSICEDKEFAGLICKDNSGRYFSTAPNRGE